MLKFTIVACLLATVTATNKTVTDFVEIIRKLPYQVNLAYYDGQHYHHRCSGSIISEDWVLTAAQCRNKKINVVLVGSHIEHEHENWAYHPTSQFIAYPQDKNSMSKKFVNDIMLVRVKQPFELSNTIQIVPMFDRDEVIQMDTMATMQFWGARDYSNSQCEYSTIMNPENVSVISNYVCHDSTSRVHSYLTEICVEYAKHHNYFCPGDAGTPLTQYSERSQENALAGILSHPGYNDRKLVVESGIVYTQVSYYRDWIKAVTGL